MPGNASRREQREIGRTVDKWTHGSPAKQVSRFRTGAAAVDRMVKLAIVKDRVYVDCKAGCAHCCYIPVAAQPQEVLAITRHIKAELSVSELADLRKRIAAAAEATAGTDTAEHMLRRVPCPFLRDNKCSIYEMRPLACRMHFSQSAVDCAGPPHTEIASPAAAIRLFNGVGSHLDGAAHNHGLVFRPSDFTTALGIALDRDDGGDAWLDGVDVFAEAVPHASEADVEYMLGRLALIE